jgi:hypothetical protein
MSDDLDVAPTKYDLKKCDWYIQRRMVVKSELLVDVINWGKIFSAVKNPSLQVVNLAKSTLLLGQMLTTIDEANNYGCKYMTCKKVGDDSIIMDLRNINWLTFFEFSDAYKKFLMQMKVSDSPNKKLNFLQTFSFRTFSENMCMVSHESTLKVEKTLTNKNCWCHKNNKAPASLVRCDCSVVHQMKVLSEFIYEHLSGVEHHVKATLVNMAVVFFKCKDALINFLSNPRSNMGRQNSPSVAAPQCGSKCVSNKNLPSPLRDTPLHLFEPKLNNIRQDVDVRGINMGVSRFAAENKESKKVTDEFAGSDHLTVEVQNKGISKNNNNWFLRLGFNMTCVSDIESVSFRQYESEITKDCKFANLCCLDISRPFKYFNIYNIYLYTGLYRPCGPTEPRTIY